MPDTLLTKGECAPIALLSPDLPDCWLFPEFLSAAECEAEIAQAQQRGFMAADRDFPQTYRNNRRQIRDDDEAANSFYVRLLQRLATPMSQRRDGTGGTWQMASINPRLRYCQYLAGQAFFLHQDGVRYADDGSRSFLTFMIYLDDPNVFEGGATRFFQGGPGSGLEDEAILTLRPPRGSLIVFDHALWHDGAEVLSGRKHVLRSDLMFVPVTLSQPADTYKPFGPRHSGYIWTTHRLLDGRIASAGRDTKIWVWSASGEADALLQGHTQSVLSMAEPTPGTLASLSRDRRLIWWDLASRREIARCDAHDGSGLALAAGGDGRLFSAGADGRLRRWDAPAIAGPSDDAQRGWIWDLVVIQHPVNAVGTRTLVFSAAESGAVRIYDVETLELLYELNHPCALRAIVAKNAGANIVLVCGDIQGQVHTWRYDGYWRSEGIQQRHHAAIRSLRWLNDERLESAGEDGDVIVDCTQTDVGFRRIGQHQGFATDVLDLGGGRLLSAGYDGCLRIAPLP
jgi:hypothetical protein